MKLIPVEFEIEGSPAPGVSGFGHPLFPPRIVQRRGFKGTFWAVLEGSLVLNKDGAWEWEPQPSSRDDDFLARTRYASPEEALAAFEAAAKKPPVYLPLP